MIAGAELVPLFVDDAIDYDVGTCIGIELCNQTLIGEAAKHQATLNPQGSNIRCQAPFGKKVRTHTSLMIQWCRKRLRFRLYKIVNKEAVITAPASPPEHRPWNWRGAVQQAVRLAGFNEDKALTEEW
ncbi:hypothetical protein TIFTF001_049198 [Ficus carica]|uniref:Uncharacterized protein n=1 Tax=Ficus carica TaxID=3494 RepID=A0AA88CNY1_FICCA|nr:hypothetical protein TIFTF001_049198 [Ficus carica]